VALLLSALAAVFVVTLAVFPQVRAALQDTVRSFGKVAILETGNYPGDQGLVTILQPETLSLADAQAQLGDRLRVPSWAPDGFVLQDRVQVHDLVDRQSTFIELEWRRTDGLRLWLRSEWPPQDSALLHVVGTDSAEEVSVYGERAVVIRGVWNADKKEWTPSQLMQLYWESEGVVYQLETVQQDAVTVAELVRMAESLPRSTAE